MKRTTLKLIVSLAIIGFMGWVFLFNSTKPRVLVLQSQSQKSDWTLRIEDGMKEILRNNRFPVSVQYHYMSLDQAGGDAKTRTAIRAAFRTIERDKPDVIISVDDESNALVTSKLDASSRPGIVYLSILQPPEVYGFSPGSQTTGLREKIPFTAIKDIIAMARPGKPLKIAALGVDQVTGQAEMSQFKAQDWGEHIIGPTALVKTFAQWREFVGKSLSDSDVLIVMSTDMLMADAEEKVVPEKEVIQWTEKHATPLPIGIRASYVRYGGGLSVSSPPRVYGLLGMHMTLQWLSAGVDSAPPAAMEIPDFNVSMRTPELEKRKVTLPQVYRELARASGGLFP